MLQAQTPSLPITKLNNINLASPVTGTKNDSVLVWRGSDKNVRFLPISGFVPKKTSDIQNDGDGTSKFTKISDVYRGGKVEYPNEVTFRPFSIYANDWGYVISKTIKSIVGSKIEKMRPYYVNYQTGSNSNNGLTEAAAFKTIAVAYANGARLIYLTGGIHKIDSWGTLNSSYTNTDDLFIIGIGSTPNIVCSAPAVTPTITLQSGTTYQATDVNIRIVVDMKYTDNNGFPLRLTEKFSISEVNSNLGSYFYDTATNNIYFNLPDGRVPDSDTMILTRLRNAEYRANAGYHYTENITFMGGGSTTGTHGVASQISSSSTLINLAKKCTFIYGQALAYSSTGGEGTRNLYNKLNWYEDCVSYNNARDGFNYLSDPANPMSFVEYNCSSFENDWRRETNNVNGSSFHGPGFGIRVNFNAYKNSGPNIADVDGARIFNVNVRASESTASTVTDTLYNADFAVESNAGMAETKMFLYDCASLNSVRSYSITGSNPSYIYIHPENISVSPTQIITPSAPQQIVYGIYPSSSKSISYIYPSLSTFVANSEKAVLSGPQTFTGVHSFPTPAVGTNTTQVGTTAFTVAEIARYQTVSAATTTQTAATLNSSYPTAPVMFRVYAPNVGSGMTYVKTTSGGQWISISAITLNP